MAKKRESINLDNVLDPKFYEEDLEAFDCQIEESQSLYEEAHQDLERLRKPTAGGILGQETHKGATKYQMYDIVTRIRTNTLDAINKRSSLKLSISAMVQRTKGANDVGDSVQTAREMIRLMVTADAKTQELKKSVMQNDKPQRANLGDDEIERRISEEMNRGGIKLTANERAMKYKIQDIEYVYDTGMDKFCARVKETGEILSDQQFPRDRIPPMKMTRDEGDACYTDTGLRIEKI